MSNLIKHLKNQLNLDQFDIKFSKDYFELIDSSKQVIYKEALFSENEKFNVNSLKTLKSVANNEQKKIPENFDFFKSWFFITHEKYFIEDVKYDKYDRIGISNLLPEFHQILKVPIADILKKELNSRLGTSYSPQQNFYLTCDFDHLNIWDVWGFKDFAREVVYSMRGLKLKKTFEITASYFLSRKTKKFNYFLNEDMFSFNSIFQNIGFFICSKKKGLDGNFNYQNKVVQKYLESLKEKHVKIGLHTSFYTHDEPNTIFEQATKFKSIFKTSPELNRHHYLRFIFPNYLSTLEEIGVKKDFSIYFPENTLFRCGTSSRFTPWNESKKQPSTIELYPITLMDGTFSDYLKCSFDDAKKLSLEKIKLSIKYSTDIVLLWHNRSTYKNSNIQNNYHPELIEFLKIEIPLLIK